jgi:signal transduction histidine kinase
VDVELKNGGASLMLQVADNGIGLPQSPATERKSLGLLGMQERALRVGGEVNIGSQPGHGTRVTVTIPTHKAAA